MKDFKFDKIQILFTALIAVLFLVIGFIIFRPTPGPGKLFTATVVKVEPITFNTDPNQDPRNTMSNGSWVYVKNGLKTVKLYSSSGDFPEDYSGCVFQFTYKLDVMRDYTTGRDVQVRKIESDNMVQDNRQQQ